MTLATHLDQLRDKHETLKSRIREEEQHPGADHLEIVALKREKLHVKEEIERISREVH
jgi:hypothetical protein